MRLILLLLLVINPISTSAELNADSLRTQWNNKAQTDSLRLDAVHKLAFEVYRIRNLDSSAYYAQKQLDFARAANLKHETALALNTLGLLNRNDLKTALKFYNESLQIREEIGDIKGVGGSLNNIGLAYIAAGLKSKGINYYQRALHKFDEIGELQYKAVCLGNIGRIYTDQKNYESAIKYLNEALAIYKALHKEWDINSITFVRVLVHIYVQQKKFDLALSLTEKCLEFAIERQLSEFVLEAELRIGEIYLEQNQLDKAKEKFQTLLITFEEINNKNGIEIVNLGMGFLNLKEKKYEAAVAKCKRAFLYGLEMNNIYFEKEGCNCLYKGYKGMGKGIEALQYFERVQKITDSLKDDDLDKKLQVMEIEKQLYQDSVKLAEEEREKQLSLDKLTASKKRKNRIQYSAVIIIVLLLASALAIFTKFKISPRLASGLIFIFFILTFEFLLVVLDPWVDRVSNGEVGWKIGINTAIALVLFGIHQVSEKYLKSMILEAH
ncbi:MAG: tetratricopeptide repeat protein [Bacteroidia bacterium]